MADTYPDPIKGSEIPRTTEIGDADLIQVTKDPDATAGTEMIAKSDLFAGVQVDVEPSGGDDLAMLQAAVAKAAVGASSTKYGVVRLNGEFQISDTLDVTAAVCLEGVGLASITWTGAVDIAKYCISTGSPVKNLYLLCGQKCRGLHCRNVTHKRAVEFVRMWQPNGMGIFADRCWGSTFEQITFTDAFKAGIYLYQCNNTTWNKVAFSSSLTDFSGTDEYAMKFEDSNLIHMTNISFEDCTFGANAAIYFETTNSVTMDTIRLENNVGTGYIVDVTAGTSNGRNLKFYNIGTSGAQTFFGFLTTTGTSKIMIDGVEDKNGIFTDRIAWFDNGTHFTPIVTGVISSLDPKRWALVSGGATVTNQEALWVAQLADDSTRNYQLYYSTDQNTLIFKDGNGSIFPVTLGAEIPPTP